MTLDMSSSSSFCLPGSIFGAHILLVYRHAEHVYSSLMPNNSAGYMLTFFFFLICHRLSSRCLSCSDGWRDGDYFGPKPPLIRIYQLNSTYCCCPKWQSNIIRTNTSSYEIKEIESIDSSTSLISAKYNQI